MTKTSKEQIKDSWESFKKAWKQLWTAVVSAATSLWNLFKWACQAVDAWDKKIWEKIEKKKQEKWKDTTWKVKKFFRSNILKIFLWTSVVLWWTYWWQKIAENIKDKNEENTELVIDNEEKDMTKTNLKAKPLNLKYNELNNEKIVKINYPTNQYSVEWRITRCLRWSSITNAVEDRYWIPRWLLMAMMAQEWRWDPTVINQRNSTNSKKTCDWWAGLIHIQAVNANNYWMHTLPRFTDAMTDYEHWEKLEEAKQKTWNNLAKLSELDDRFNPVLAVDLAARFLMNDCKWKNCKKDNVDDRLNAVWCYNNPTKTKNWTNRNYMYSVLVYWATINNVNGDPMPKIASKEVKRVIEWEVSASVNWKYENTKSNTERVNNRINNNIIVLDNDTVTTQEYYEYMKSQCENYWLNDYENFNKKHPYIK